MTLDEAIKICEEDAEKIGGNPQSDCHAERCRRFAEWLTDYKELKNSIGAVKLSNMKEALELIQAYKTENATLREENKVLTSECDRLIKEKDELNKLKEKAMLDICRREARLKEAKQLLKALVEDLNATAAEVYNGGVICKCCKWKSQIGKCSCPDDGGCDTDYRWRYVDEAEKLIGEDVNGI